jgi:hypothetical protein
MGAVSVAFVRCPGWAVEFAERNRLFVCLGEAIAANECLAIE